MWSEDVTLCSRFCQSVQATRTPWKWLRDVQSGVAALNSPTSKNKCLRFLGIEGIH